MSYVAHKLTALAVTDPKQAKEEILNAYKKAKAHLRDAAAVLGVSYATLERMLDRLEMRDLIAKLNALAVKEGWHHGKLGGRTPNPEPKPEKREKKSTPKKKAGGRKKSVAHA